jgi:hypothetical protein
MYLPNKARLNAGAMCTWRGASKGTYDMPTSRHSYLFKFPVRRFYTTTNHPSTVNKKKLDAANQGAQRSGKGNAAYIPPALLLMMIHVKITASMPKTVTTPCGSISEHFVSHFEFQ